MKQMIKFSIKDWFEKNKLYILAFIAYFIYVNSLLF